LLLKGKYDCERLSAQQPDATTITTQPALSSVATIHRRAVPPNNLYTHIITVVPLTGKGTYEDPKRPLYLPAARPQATSRTGILGFTYLPSDDGHFAIVEFVVADKTALKPVYADATLTIFEKGIHSQAAIEAAMQKFRKGFSLNNFGVAVR
jgi:hypothetical protein